MKSCINALEWRSIASHCLESTCGFPDSPACRCASEVSRTSRSFRSRSFLPLEVGHEPRRNRCRRLRPGVALDPHAAKTELEGGEASDLDAPAVSETPPPCGRASSSPRARYRARRAGVASAQFDGSARTSSSSHCRASAVGRVPRRRRVCVGRGASVGELTSRQLRRAVSGPRARGDRHRARSGVSDCQGGPVGGGSRA